MKKLIKEFYDAHVKDGDDLKLFVAALFLIAAALGVAAYDIVTIVRGTVDPNAHMPFVLAGGLVAFSSIALAILRHSATCERCRRVRTRDYPSVRYWTSTGH